MVSQAKLMVDLEGVLQSWLSELQLGLWNQDVACLKVYKEECFEATEGNNPSEDCHVVWFHNHWVDFNDILTQYPWDGVVPVFTSRRHCQHPNMIVVPPVESVQGLGCGVSKFGRSELWSKSYGTFCQSCLKLEHTHRDKQHSIVSQTFVSFLAHLAYMPMSLFNHYLSIMCHCCHHWCCCCWHQHCLCTAVPVTVLFIETSYLVDTCTYIPNICT